MWRFLGIGAQKAGTTWLSVQLLRHPDIGMPHGKEAHFWNTFHGDSNPEARVAQYLSAYMDPAKVQGEITPAYAMLPLETVQRIHAMAPDLRLIYLLRNPVERAWSSACMALGRAELTIDDVDDRWFLTHFQSRGSLARGDYAACIRTWRQVFSAEQLLILDYADVVDAPEHLLAQVAQHVGVDPACAELYSDCHERVFAGEQQAFPSRFRERLLEIYRPGIRELEEMLDQDFSHWLTTPEDATGGVAPSVQGDGPNTSAAPAALAMAQQQVADEIASSRFFDARFYRQQYPELALRSDHEALQHFVSRGAMRGLRASAGFDTAWYLRQNPDVAQAGINPLLHYLRFGAEEGRSPYPSAADTAAQPLEAVQTPDACAFTDFSSYERRSLFLLQVRPVSTEAGRCVYGHLQAQQRHRLAAARDVTLRESVTVILPWLAGEDWPQHAIESVRAQSHAAWELLVVVDAANVLPSHVRKADDLRCLIAEAGLSRARAHAVGRDAANGVLVTYLDADSTLEPEALRLRVHALVDDARSEMVYCARLQVAPHDAAAADTPGGDPVSSIRAIDYAVFSRALLENRDYLPMSCVLHRWPFPDTTGSNVEGDRALLLRLTQRVAAKTLPCALVRTTRDELPASLLTNAATDRFSPEAAAGSRLVEQLDHSTIAGLDQMFGPAPRRWPATPRPVTIIVPSYECAAHLRLCLEAVAAFTPSQHRVVVVDNASNPQLRQELAAAHAAGRLHCIQNTSNLGFTYAVNQGLQVTDADDDVVLLNNDAVVTPGWLAALQHTLARFPDAGLVVPRQVLLPGTPTMSVHSPLCDVQREIDVNLSAHHDNVADVMADDADGCMALSFAPFFCTYLPASTRAQLGPLDHLHGAHYRSDVLYCEAVRRILGQRIIYTPHAKVYHFLQQATEALRTENALDFETLFLRNHFPGTDGSEQVGGRG